MFLCVITARCAVTRQQRRQNCYTPLRCPRMSTVVHGCPQLSTAPPPPQQAVQTQPGRDESVVVPLDQNTRNQQRGCSCGPSQQRCEEPLAELTEHEKEVLPYRPAGNPAWQDLQTGFDCQKIHQWLRRTWLVRHGEN